MKFYASSLSVLLSPTLPWSNDLRSYGQTTLRREITRRVSIVQRIPSIYHLDWIKPVYLYRILINIFFLRRTIFDCIHEFHPSKRNQRAETDLNTVYNNYTILQIQWELNILIKISKILSGRTIRIVASLKIFRKKLKSITSILTHIKNWDWFGYGI